MIYPNTIKIGNEHLSFTRDFINGTRLKEFIYDKVDIHEKLLKYVTDCTNYYATTYWCEVESELIEYIQISLIILNDYHYDNHNTHIFNYLTNDDYSKIRTGVIRWSNMSMKVLGKYYILSLIVDFLCFDKRMLCDHEEWMTIIQGVGRGALSVENKSKGKKLHLVLLVKHSVSRYTSILPFRGKFILPLRTTNFNNKFISDINAILLFVG